MLEVRFAIYFQNDPLTNFMHIFRKQSFHTYDLPKIYIFCGACHSMSTVKIWGNTISRTPFYKHLNIWRTLGAARRYANVAARTTRVNGLGKTSGSLLLLIRPMRSAA